MRVVSNTSPLIFLAKIKRLELLTQLYQEVIIPVSAFEELQSKPGDELDQAEAMLGSHRFALEKAILLALSEIPANLGAGERETIALATQIKAYLVLIDDRYGRQIARQQRLSKD